MTVPKALALLLLSVGALANDTFRYEDGVVDSRCPVYDNPMNPIHLPHARDCGKFLKCYNGRAFTINCPSGQEFGPQIQRCDYPMFAQCRSVLAQPEPAEFRFEEGVGDERCPRTDDPMNPAHLRHATDCQKFFKCFNGRRFEFGCPAGQEWAARLNRCDRPEVAKCRVQVKPTEPEPVPLADDAEKAVEENEPQQNVVEDVVEDVAAEDAQTAEEIVEAVPMKAEFVYESGVPDVRCPRTDDPFRPIHLPHPTDCSKFQKCFDGRTYTLNCPPGQEYGAKINRCDFPQFAQCTQLKRKRVAKRLSKAAAVDDDYYYDYYSDEVEFPLNSSEWTEEQREMIAGVPDIRCPQEDEEDSPVHLTHPKDCGKFYKCYDGRAYLIVCPLGQHWSVRYDRCDYPKVAKCTIRP